MTRPPNPELPEKIVEAAEEIVVVEGYRALSMRLLAERAGVTPTTLYYYFKSKDHVVLALRLRAARGLAEHIRRVRRPDDLRAAGRALGEAYIAYAEENAELYTLLMGRLGDQSIVSADDERVLRSAYDAAREMLAELKNRGEWIGDPDQHAMIGWIMLHGFSTLLITGTLESAHGLDKDALRSAFLDLFCTGATGIMGPAGGPGQ